MRRRNRQKKKIIIGSLSILLFLCVGYAAFSTNLNITAKGNIKDINIEVDKKVPKEQLIFWGQANNKENTLNILKDKSGNNNDGTLYNFNNTSQSGFNNGELILDGVDDYVYLGMESYDFKNSISYVVYVKILSITTNQHNIIIGNWYNYSGNKGGGGLYVHMNNYFIYDVFDGTNWTTPNTYNTPLTLNQYYTVVGTNDNNSAKIYIDGELKDEIITQNNALGISDGPMRIGAFTGDLSIDELHHFGNFALKEAMIYDRALSEEEVKLITEGFQKKYKNS